MYVQGFLFFLKSSKSDVLPRLLLVEAAIAAALRREAAAAVAVAAAAVLEEAPRPLRPPRLPSWRLP